MAWFDRRVHVDDGRPCENCGATSWDFGVIAGPADEDPDVLGYFVEVAPTPMARCSACGYSQRLDGTHLRPD